MNGYKIIDWIRKTNSVEVCKSYLELIKTPDINHIAKDIQRKNLTTFLSRLRNNDFYRQYLVGITDDEIRNNPYEVIKCFPIADKSFIRDNYDKIRNLVWKGENAYTGGSTGAPFHYIVDKKLLSNVVGFTLFLWHHLAGYNFGDNVVVVGGTSIGDKKNPKKRLLHYLQKRSFISGGEINEDNAKALISLINTAKHPIVLYGYPSSICEYISLIKQLRLELNRQKIKSVITTSETLFTNRREKIEQFFGHKVANLYGARDGGISSGSLDDRTFIYNGIDCYAENVEFDGINELVLTNLYSDAFPFVRYRIGDVADLSIANKGYPFLLSNLTGRTRDFITLPDGRKIHGSKINKLFSHHTVSEYQIIQHIGLNCDVKIVRAGDIDQTKISEELMALLDGVECKIAVVDSILRNKNNKLRNIISEIE